LRTCRKLIVPQGRMEARVNVEGDDQDMLRIEWYGMWFSRIFALLI
jgi:hypothetical protein